MSDERLMLSQKEIDRFAAWLTQEADTAVRTAKQLEALYSTSGDAITEMAKRERQYAVAATVVAAKLQSIEIVEAKS